MVSLPGFLHPNFYRVQKKVESFILSDSPSAESILLKDEPSKGKPPGP
jgi:hypothetical protein